ncbi:MAG TPA: hypothetical protein VMZ52_06060 [Bryobacteraceae bacterium]|nr:hypothetical protein [Bryobacteraceae bacterium]
MRISKPMNVNPEALLGYSNAVYIIGAIITLMGTFGIVYYSNVSSKIKESELKHYQKEAEAKIATANATAESARAEAASARRDAATATRDAESFRSDIAAAHARVALAAKDSAEANERAKKYEAAIAEANLRSTEAEKKSLEAGLELAKFKAPRRLNDEQRSRLKEKASAFAGQVFSVGVSADPESTAFAQIIEDILLSAGWKQEKLKDAPILLADKWAVVIGEGVKVQMAPSHESRLTKTVLSLTSALIDEGIVAEANRNKDLEKQPDWVHIVIGSKP